MTNPATESNDTGDASVLVTMRPTTSSHPSRRHLRLSHGAAAVRTAAVAATPAVVGNVDPLSAPSPPPTSTGVVPASTVTRWSRIRTRSPASTPAAATVTSIRHRPCQRA